MLLFEEKIKVNSTAFTNKVRDIAAKHGLEPDWLMAVMNFETGGSFSPSVKNPSTNATGLIQFMPKTAPELGTTVDALAGMTNVQQLDYVDKYIGNVILRHGHLNNIGDMYMSILYPAAIAWPLDQIFPNPVYLQNRGFDLNKDGQLSKQEIIDKVLSTIPAAYRDTMLKKKTS